MNEKITVICLHVYAYTCMFEHFDFFVCVVKNVSCGAVEKSGYVCLPRDIFPLSLMGLNAAVDRCSCQFNAHRAKSFCAFLFCV